MLSRRAHVLVILLTIAGCGADQGGIELPPAGAVPGGKGDDATDETEARDDPADVPAAQPPLTRSSIVRVGLSTELSLGGRGTEVLCPDPQILEVGGAYLSSLTTDGTRTEEVATLCAIDVPGFVVSAHGALGGCDETRIATIASVLDVAEIARPSVLEAPFSGLDAMPVAFVLGAALHDDFAQELPDWSTPDLWRDDDGDGNPGVTLVGHGLPLVPDGAELYAAVRLLVTPTTAGHAEASLEVSLLGSNAGFSGRTLGVIAPSLRAGMVVTFERQEVPEGTTCTEALARAE